MFRSRQQSLQTHPSTTVPATSPSLNKYTLHVLQAIQPIIDFVNHELIENWIAYEANLPQSYDSMPSIYTLPGPNMDPTLLHISAAIISTLNRPLHRLSLEHIAILNRAQRQHKDAILKMTVPASAHLPVLRIFYVPLQAVHSQTTRRLCYAARIASSDSSPSSLRHSSSRFPVPPFARPPPAIIALQSHLLDSEQALENLTATLRLLPCPPIILVWGPPLLPTLRQSLERQKTWPFFLLMSSTLRFMNAAKIMHALNKEVITAKPDTIHPQKLAALKANAPS